MEPHASPDRRHLELKVFGVLALLLAPILSIAAVGSYGFVVWMYQIMAGPPSVSTISPPPKAVVMQPK